MFLLQPVCLCDENGQPYRCNDRVISNLLGSCLSFFLSLRSFSSNNGDRRSSVGAAALITLPPEAGGARVILATKRSQVVNPDVWESFGLDWRREFEVMAVKSTNHFYVRHQLHQEELTSRLARSLGAFEDNP